MLCVCVFCAALLIDKQTVGKRDRDPVPDTHDVDAYFKSLLPMAFEAVRYLRGGWVVDIAPSLPDHYFFISRHVPWLEVDGSPACLAEPAIPSNQLGIPRVVDRSCVISLCLTALHVNLQSERYITFKDIEFETAKPGQDLMQQGVAGQAAVMMTVPSTVVEPIPVAFASARLASGGLTNRDALFNWQGCIGQCRDERKCACPPDERTMSVDIVVASHVHDKARREYVRRCQLNFAAQGPVAVLSPSEEVCRETPQAARETKKRKQAALYDSYSSLRYAPSPLSAERGEVEDRCVKQCVRPTAFKRMTHYEDSQVCKALSIDSMMESATASSSSPFLGPVVWDRRMGDPIIRTFTDADFASAVVCNPLDTSPLPTLFPFTCEYADGLAADGMRRERFRGGFGGFLFVPRDRYVDLVTILPAPTVCNTIVTRVTFKDDQHKSFAVSMARAAFNANQLAPESSDFPQSMPNILYCLFRTESGVLPPFFCPPYAIAPPETRDYGRPAGGEIRLAVTPHQLVYVEWKTPAPSDILNRLPPGGIEVRQELASSLTASREDVFQYLRGDVRRARDQRGCGRAPMWFSSPTTSLRGPTSSVAESSASAVYSAQCAYIFLFQRAASGDLTPPTSAKVYLPPGDAPLMRQYQDIRLRAGRGQDRDGEVEELVQTAEVRREICEDVLLDVVDRLSRLSGADDCGVRQVTHYAVAKPADAGPRCSVCKCLLQAPPLRGYPPCSLYFERDGVINDGTPQQPVLYYCAVGACAESLMCEGIQPASCIPATLPPTRCDRLPFLVAQRQKIHSLQGCMISDRGLHYSVVAALISSSPPSLPSRIITLHFVYFPIALELPSFLHFLQCYLSIEIERASTSHRELASREPRLDDNFLVPCDASSSSASDSVVLDVDPPMSPIPTEDIEDFFADDDVDLSRESPCLRPAAVSEQKEVLPVLDLQQEEDIELRVLLDKIEYVTCQQKDTLERMGELPVGIFFLVPSAL